MLPLLSRFRAIISEMTKAGTTQYFRIGNTGGFCTNPNYVMSLLAQGFYGIQGEVFVGKKTHRLDRNGINFFRLEGSTGVAQTGLDIFKADTGIIAKDFVGTPALGKEINDEFNSEASTSNNGFTNQDIWVEGDASLLIHK